MTLRRFPFSPARRGALRRAARAAAWLGLGAPLPSACSRNAPRVAIVGAGLAGLVAADTLERAGISADVYEAADRAGGRVLTARDALGPGSSVELGAEFIAADHADVIALARELRVDLAAVQPPAPDAARTAYFFGGAHYEVAQVSAELQPLIERIALDARAAGDLDRFRTLNDAARALDALSVPAYLDRIGARGWVRELVELVCVSEFGLDAEAQSALNLVQRVGRGGAGQLPDTLGLGTRSYRVAGGTDRLVRALAERVRGQIQYGRHLVRLRRDGTGYALTLKLDDATTTAHADIVILAVPFSVLRDVELDLPLPDEKRLAISQLGYGSHARLLAGFARPVWRAQGYSGTLLTDAPLQTCWEQPNATTTGAIVTFQLGGRPGVELGHDTPEQQVNRLVVGLERAFPGARDARDERVLRFHWASYRHSKGSRACYKPGQWAAFGGVESEPVDRLLFAGEHCSRQFAGTMNGAVRSGRMAAQAVISLAGR